MHRLTKVAIGIVISIIVAAGAFMATSRAGGLIGVQWTQVGPAPLSIDAEQNYQGAGPDSGQVTEIAIDPRGTSDQNIFISTNDGGIWKSTDGGTTWKPKTDYLATLSMGAVALDAGNPSIVYAGTGNQFNNGFFNAVGIYKSTDGGDSWTLAPGSSTLGNRAIIRMVSPAANVLVVATGTGLFRSIDGGTTFTNIIPPGASSSSYITDLKLDTTAANNVLAAVYGLGIYLSTDGGATFGANLFTVSNGSPQQSNPGQIGYIAFGQSTAPDHQTIYATVQNTTPSPSRFLGMWKSINGGANWANLAGANAAGNADGNAGGGCQCGYDQTVGVDPLDATRVYIGFQELWLSTDGGATFSASAVTLNQVHWDHHALVFSPPAHVGVVPTTPLYVGQDGGIATSSDGGTTWTNINGPTSGVGAIATNLFRGIDIGRNGSGNNQYTYGGTQDTGTVEFRPPFTNQNWHLGIDGDGGPVAVDPCTPDVAIGNDDGGYIRSTNGGATWGGGGGFAANSSVGAVAFDPTCDSIAYTGVATAPTPTSPPDSFNLYQSTDDGANYSLIHFVGATVSIDAIGTTKADANVVWLGLSDGTLQYTTNALLGGASTWTNVTIPGVIAGQGVSSVAVDPVNTQTVVVTYPGFSGVDPNLAPTKHVFMTTDNGVNWTDISGTISGGIKNLPDLPINSVVIDSNTTPHTVIVASDAAVFQSPDVGNSWQVLGLGLPTVQCTSLALDPSATPELLRVGTYGRSVFELGAATGPLLQYNSTFDFGTICGSKKATEVLQLFNVGASDLHISSIGRVAGSNDFTLSGPGTPVTIKPGGEIDYTITFSSTNAGTTETATFQINSDDEFKPVQQVTYTATVGAATAGAVIANSGSFGNVCFGSFLDLNLTITNSGSCDLVISGVASTNPLFKVASVISYPITVHAGGSVSIPIRYEPSMITAVPDTGSITISSNDLINPIISVPVSGSSSPGKIAITGSGSFGNVCAENATQQTITVNNVGTCNLSVTSAMSSCADFTLVNNPFPNVISPDSGLNLTVKFTPTSVGPKSCNLTINSDDPSDPVNVTPLTGNTPSPALSIDTAGVNLPPTLIQNRGACHSQVGIPVANAGQCNVTVNSLGISGTDAADYSLTGTPALPIALGAGEQLGSGDLDAVFAPTTLARTKTANVDVTWVTDPILNTTTTQSVPMCGEATSRGLRVLVTQGGVPVAKVRRIILYYVNQFGFQEPALILVQRKWNVLLSSVSGMAPCPSFQYHFEYGAVGNPIALKPGNYVVAATIVSGGHLQTKRVKANINTCDFAKNIVVAF